MASQHMDFFFSILGPLEKGAHSYVRLCLLRGGGGSLCVCAGGPGSECIYQHLTPVPSSRTRSVPFHSQRHHHSQAPRHKSSRLEITSKDRGNATTQNLVVKFDGEICSRVLVENASDDFPQQKKLENLLPNFAGSSPPISPKTLPTSLWKSLVLIIFQGKSVRSNSWGSKPDTDTDT